MVKNLEKVKGNIEIINSGSQRGNFKSALFDFDGTVSLIREGWRDVMIPYFVEVLKKTPEAEDEESLISCVSDFVDFLTGKQTIYQCISLDEEVRRRGGKHVDPLEYKRQYHKILFLITIFQKQVEEHLIITITAIALLNIIKHKYTYMQKLMNMLL